MSDKLSVRITPALRTQIDTIKAAQQVADPKHRPVTDSDIVRDGVKLLVEAANYEAEGDADG